LFANIQADIVKIALQLLAVLPHQTKKKANFEYILWSDIHSLVRAIQL